MNILFITHCTTLYGANKALLDLVIDLRDRYNVNPIILIPKEGDFTKILDEHKIEFIVSKYCMWLREKKIINIFKDRIKKTLNILFFRKIYNKLSYRKIDIIHTNSSLPYIGEYLSQKLNIPHIKHLREYGDEDYNLYYMYSDKFIKNKYNKNVNCAIAISKSIKQKYKKYFTEDKIHMIYDGVDMPIDKVKCNSDKSIIEFVVVGGINETKNQMEILQSVKILRDRGIKNFKVNLVGSGNDKYIDKVNQFIIKNDLCNLVNLLGYRDDIDKILQSMDIGIVSSKKEAFGRVTIEYMLNSMPVIGADTGGTSELIKNNINGLLYRLNDYNDLADKMEFFIKERINIERMSKSSYNYAKLNFNKKLNTDKIYKIYKDILQKQE